MTAQTGTNKVTLAKLKVRWTQIGKKGKDAEYG